MSKFGRALLLGAALAGLSGTVSAQLGTVRFDNWFYYQENYGDSERWQYRPRVLIPFAFGDGWTFTQRIDVPLYYTNATGPANTDGDWKFRISDIFFEEILDTPDVAKNFRFRTSVRLVTPTGGEPPFGSDQWQVALGGGFNWRLPDVLKGVTVVPYVRYFWGFDAGSPNVTTVRKWNIFPEVDFKLADNWTLLFYPEQGISYNDRSNKWFVPIEAMVANQVSKSWSYAFGGAYAIVNDDPSYRWLVQARVSFYF
ncbi:MAG: hypothetical protein H6R20_560 [Proteobacteria bacterium]|nr:hypothetical protein [Pseudomonadota bacterium]